jgi:hypothetical protein
MSLDPSQPSFAHSRHLEQVRKGCQRTLSGHYSREKKDEAIQELAEAQEKYDAAVARDALAK